jgi:hypothetical protein
VPTKYFRLYFISGFVFLFDVVLAIAYFAFSEKMIGELGTTTFAINIIYGIGFGTVALISLIAIGIYRFAKFKIDLTIFRRRHGEVTGETNETTPTESTVVGQAPTSGLTSNADQK